MNIALVGLGLIGKERLEAILKLKENGYECDFTGIFDTNQQHAEKIAEKYQLPIFQSIEQIIKEKPDWVIVSVPHDIAVTMTKLFLSHHINVLVEKPLGRTVAEAKEMLHCESIDAKLYVGFNYRFYQGIQQAYRDMQAKKFGNIISINIELGHGGRPGDEKTWKLDAIKCGGGCLIDPGVHLLDLIQCFSQTPIKVVAGQRWQGFWNTGIEEECHLLLKNDITTFNINVSIVRWRSTFKFEIHGTDGYGKVFGRNRSYGHQTYQYGKRWGWMDGKSQSESEELLVTTDGEDTFYQELEALLFKKDNAAIKPCTGREALATMQLLESCMLQSSIHSPAHQQKELAL